MRSGIRILVLALGMSIAAQASADGIHINSDHCGFNTHYDVRATPAGIAFARTDGQPARVFMHDGQLRVDDRIVTVSPGDADRLRRYEAGVRSLLPEVAQVAQEAMAWPSTP
jgi:hypothetical protein